MTEIDPTDRKILNLLQTEGRISNADLAEQINLSPSACLRRVRRLEDEGVIDSYVALLDQTAIGKPSDIFVEITVASQRDEALRAFEAAVAELPDVMECYLMSGSSDYMLRVAASDTADFERIHKNLAQLPGLERTRSSFVLRTVCKKTAFHL